MTRFDEIYDRFFGKITDDMYDLSAEDPSGWTKEDTESDVFNILLDSLPGFEFPRFSLYAYSKKQETVVEKDEEGYPREVVKEFYAFDSDLTSEEINILALLMVNTWVHRQVASIENTRMKVSGAEFKMTSQANHLAKLLDLEERTTRESFHMQRLYRRRKSTQEGRIESNWSVLREVSVFDD